MIAIPTFRGPKFIEHVGERRAKELGSLDEWAVFGGHAPDSAMSFVAIWMAEARLVVADNRVVPVGNVERAVRTKLHIDRTKA